MNEFLSNLGYAIIKLIVSVMLGAGVTVLLMGLFVANDPNWFRRPDPPGVLFVASGLGFITMAGLLVFFFLLPWPPRVRSANLLATKDEWRDEPISPKAENDGAFQSRPSK